MSPRTLQQIVCHGCIGIFQGLGFAGRRFELAGLAVFAGRAVADLLEGTGEVGWVLEAGLIADAGNRHLAVDEQVHGQVHALAQDVIQKPNAVDFLEQAAEAGRGHAAALCDVLLVDAFAKMLVDVWHDLAERLVLVVFAGQANAVRQRGKVVDALRIA